MKRIPRDQLGIVLYPNCSPRSRCDTHENASWRNVCGITLLKVGCLPSCSSHVWQLRGVRKDACVRVESGQTSGRHGTSVAQKWRTVNYSRFVSADKSWRASASVQASIAPQIACRAASMFSGFTRSTDPDKMPGKLSDMGSKSQTSAASFWL